MSEDARTTIEKGWVITYSGRRVDIKNPARHSISVLDIVHHSSQINRFTGATKWPYFLAQHAMLVAKLVIEILEREDHPRDIDYWDQVMAALLHDAEEYLTNDLSSPIKAEIGGRYNWIATGLRRAIFSKFQLDWEWYNATVKEADNIAILIERGHLLPDNRDWPIDAKVVSAYPCPQSMPSTAAKMAYARMIAHVQNERDKLRPPTPDPLLDNPPPPPLAVAA